MLATGTSWSGEIAGGVTYDYDNDFRVSGITVNGSSTAFGYDADSLLVQAGDLNLAREPDTGRLDVTTLGSVATDTDYSGFGELAAVNATVSGNAIYAVDYQRDVLGRITTKTETVNGETVTTHYGYDTAGRLDRVDRNGIVTTYGYDANGNRTHVNGIEIAEYDVQDRLLEYGNCSYTTTTNGEWQSRNCNGAGTHYDYDVMGNLRRAELPNGTEIDYVIDAQNRRIGKKINGNLVQGFLYQDQLNPVAELDGSGNVVARFIYADKANVPSYMEKNGNTYRIISDHLGSPRLVIDTASGNIVQQMDYDAWGNVIEDTNPGFQPFGFAGGIYDQQTGLVRFGARDYDPETGRWTAKDPIGFDGGTENLYEYSANDPINYFDPNGLLYGVNAGESYGASAAQYWADRAAETGNPLYHLPGGLAALWTPCTSDATASTLLGGYAARVLGPFSPKGVPKYLQRLRKYLRFDRPHHGKGWEFDGVIPKAIRDRLKDYGGK